MSVWTRKLCEHACGWPLRFVVGFSAQVRKQQNSETLQREVLQSPSVCVSECSLWPQLSPVISLTVCCPPHLPAPYPSTHTCLSTMYQCLSMLATVVKGLCHCAHRLCSADFRLTWICTVFVFTRQIYSSVHLQGQWHVIIAYTLDINYLVLFAACLHNCA